MPGALSLAGGSAADIQPEAIRRLGKKLDGCGVDNATTKVASAYGLPFAREGFDLAFMVAVLAEMPDRVRP